MHPLDTILNSWRQEDAGALFSKTRSMGSAFEQLCRAYLTHDPTRAQYLEDVQPFGEWAKARGMAQSDTGIDLVAKLRNEAGYAAIQCKFRKDQGHHRPRRACSHNSMRDDSPTSPATDRVTNMPMTQPALRAIIEDFRREIDTKKVQLNPHQKAAIAFRNEVAENKEWTVYKVPIDQLWYRKENSRIASSVMSHERVIEPLDTRHGCYCRTEADQTSGYPVASGFADERTTH